MCTERECVWKEEDSDVCVCGDEREREKEREMVMAVKTSAMGTAPRGMYMRRRSARGVQQREARYVTASGLGKAAAEGQGMESSSAPVVVDDEPLMYVAKTTTLMTKSTGRKKTTMLGVGKNRAGAPNYWDYQVRIYELQMLCEKKQQLRDCLSLSRVPLRSFHELECITYSSFSLCVCALCLYVSPYECM